MERSPDDLLVERSLDDELPDAEYGNHYKDPTGAGINSIDDLKPRKPRSLLDEDTYDIHEYGDDLPF